MSKVKELFGVYCEGKPDLTVVINQQICPFSHKRCFKTRKSDSQVVIGTCVVEYQKKNVIICPNRLLENNQIFLDCLHLLTLHEPGNELYLIPEVSIPGGNVDYFLVSAQNGKVKDFIGIELQAVDTTGSVWSDRQRLLKQLGFHVAESDVQSKRSYGMNWKMTAKTILIQLLHKSETFEQLNKHLVLVIQEPFFDYIKRNFSFNQVEGVRLGDLIHIHSYDLNDNQGKLKLGLKNRISVDSNRIANCLELNGKRKLELEEITAILESKLSNDYLMTVVSR